jgi:dCMP deaminase
MRAADDGERLAVLAGELRRIWEGDVILRDGVPDPSIPLHHRPAVEALITAEVLGSEAISHTGLAQALPPGTLEDAALAQSLAAVKDRLFIVSGLEAALACAVDSPDPSTQNGAVLMGPGGAILASDCNRFPDGVAYSAERWERPLKYSLVEHAERNAIFAAVRAGVLDEGMALVCPWSACADCARAIIQSNLGRLVRIQRDPEGNDARAVNFADSISVADIMLAEAGTEVVEVVPSCLRGDPLMRNGKPFVLSGLPAS